MLFTLNEYILIFFSKYKVFFLMTFRKFWVLFIPLLFPSAPPFPLPSESPLLSFFWCPFIVPMFYNLLLVSPSPFASCNLFIFFFHIALGGERFDKDVPSRTESPTPYCLAVGFCVVLIYHKRMIVREALAYGYSKMSLEIFFCSASLPEP